MPTEDRAETRPPSDDDLRTRCETFLMVERDWRAGDREDRALAACASSIGVDMVRELLARLRAERSRTGAAAEVTAADREAASVFLTACDIAGTITVDLLAQLLAKHRSAHAQPGAPLDVALNAARAEAARLRKLFDDAGQDEHNVLALVDHYQDEALAARAEVAERDATIAELRAEVERLHGVAAKQLERTVEVCDERDAALRALAANGGYDGE